MSYLNRLIVLVSLVGLVLAAHLWAREAQAFGSDCVPCNTPALRAISHVGPVPLAALGAGFYLAVACAAAARLRAEGLLPGWTGAGRGRLLNRITRAVLGLAFGVSLGLVVYQVRVAHALCPPCLGSAALVATLLGLEGALCVAEATAQASRRLAARIRAVQGADLGGGAGNAVGTAAEVGADPEPGPAVGRFLFLAFGGAALVLAGVLVGLDGLGRTPACGLEPGEPVAVVGGGAELGAPAGLAGTGAAFWGRPGGVPVVAVLDPNCAHCRDTWEMLLRLADRYGDRARFGVAPRALWGYSVDELAALRLAERQGRAFDLWRLLFERQPAGGGTGLSPVQIAALFGELGLDTRDLRRRLAAERPAVIDEQTREAAAGGGAVPALFIGGRPVRPGPWSEACLAHLIEAAGIAQEPRR